MVKLLREVQGVRYELFTLNTLDEMALMVAEAFTHYEPLAVIQTAVAEATGVISQHILRNKFGFVDRFEIPYKTFTNQGRRVFESIKEHNGIILMDKTLV